MNKRIIKISAFLIALIMLLGSVNVTAYAKTLSAPTSVSAANNISGVKIKWKGNKNAKGYVVYKKTSVKGKWEKIADTGKKSFVDKKVKNDKAYYYSVKAYKGKKRAYSKRSKTVKCYCVKAPVISEVYENKGNVVIELKSCPDWYAVYRKTGKDGKYKELTQAELYFYEKQNKSRIEDPTVATGKTYYYKIKAVATNEKKSANSKEIKIKCSVYSGECARNGHEKLHKVKVVKPTEVLDGYTLYSCDCGKRYCARDVVKATGSVAPHEKDFAYSESVKRYNASIKYLNMVYKNDKKDLLQVCNGSTEQIRVLKKESDKIVKGCTSAYQKYKAIYNWVHDNVEYDDKTSSFPFEVMRLKRGDCQGMSRLIVDMLRLQNVPCAAVTGYAGDMKTILTEENMASLCGARHQWVMAYINGKWLLADATFDRFDPNPETFDIPEWYYTIASDYAVAYYKGMNMKMGAFYPTYINGKYYGFLENGRQTFNSFGFFADDFSFACDVNDCAPPKNNLQSFTNYNTKDKTPGAVLTGPVYTAVETRKRDETLVHISYYNGRNVRETTYTIDGKHYFNTYTTYKNYSSRYISLKYGCPVLKTGETIKLVTVNPFSNTKTVWSSDDKKVATVDQNGNVKAVGEGYTNINYTVKRGNVTVQQASEFFYVDNSSVYTIKASDMAPLDSIKTQRCKIHF